MPTSPIPNERNKTETHPPPEWNGIRAVMVWGAVLLGVFVQVVGGVGFLGTPPSNGGGMKWE